MAGCRRQRTVVRLLQVPGRQNGLEELGVGVAPRGRPIDLGLLERPCQWHIDIVDAHGWVPLCKETFGNINTEVVRNLNEFLWCYRCYVLALFRLA